MQWGRKRPFPCVRTVTFALAWLGLLACAAVPNRAHAQFFDFFVPEASRESDQGFLTRSLVAGQFV